MDIYRAKGYTRLKLALLERRIMHKDAAKTLGIDRSTFSSKLNQSGADFTLPEAQLLCLTYNIPWDTFFLEYELLNVKHKCNRGEDERQCTELHTLGAQDND